MKKFLFAVVVVILFVGCHQWRNIPAGYVGKVLTPTGWEKGPAREAGQVDIGDAQDNGASSVLVLLEISSIAPKESFNSNNSKDDEDHRIIIKKTPVTVDVYVRMIAPKEDDKRSALFASFTPTLTPSLGDRVYVITLEEVYKKFAQMDVRSGIRAVLQQQDSVETILSNLEMYNDKLGEIALKMFNKSGVPLVLQNVTISNIKKDNSILEAENEKAKALAQVYVIDQLGAAVRRNPEYKLLKKYDTYEKIASKIGNFTIIDGQPEGIVIK
jgi:hypothetical protein